MGLKTAWSQVFTRLFIESKKEVFMKCYSCYNDASLQCPRCNRFCCSSHSIREMNYSNTQYICSECAQEVSESAQKLAEERARAQREKEIRKREEDARREIWMEQDRIRKEQERKDQGRKDNEIIDCPVCGGKGKCRNPAPGPFGFEKYIACEVCHGKGELTRLEYNEHSNKHISDRGVNDFDHDLYS
jgi:hypothetical protein